MNTYLITDIELRPYPGECPELFGTLWKAEDEYDLLDRVKRYTGFRIKSMDFKQVVGDLE